MAEWPDHHTPGPEETAVKWPIIHLPKVSEQEWLFRQLEKRGYRYMGGWEDHDPIRYPYLNAYAPGLMTFYGLTPSKYTFDQYTLMNNPRQFLDYLARITK